MSEPWSILADRRKRKLDEQGVSKFKFFDKLSKNALQNVMEFFHIWGADFIKMRCINVKTKSAYMAQVSRSANIEKNFESKPADYV